MAQLAIVTKGLAPGMWAVVSKVISWEWVESSGKVRWLVETTLPAHVVMSAVPSIQSLEPVKAGDSRLPAREPAARRRVIRKRANPVAVSSKS